MEILLCLSGAVPTSLRRKVIKKYLNEVEQVGFISKNQLEMMGGELCINATLAFASTLGKRGKLKTSGIKRFVKYDNFKNQIKIEVPLKYKQKANVILSEGIGFVCIDKKSDKKINKKLLSNFCEKYNLPAFGAIVYEKNKIIPYVYVKETGSFVRETACGSGSIAFSIFSRYKNIIQPTGKLIRVNIKNGKVLVNSEVEEVRK